MRVFLAVMLCVPVVALAAGVQKPHRADPEAQLCTSFRNAALSAGGGICAVILPASRGFVLKNLSAWFNTASGGGAGNTVIQFTDGTNVCTFTLACATSQTPAVRRISAAGACTFAPGATVTGTVATAGCTTTQPGIVNAIALGDWL